MFKDSFNCLNDVHKRCILNSNEFCTHLEILKKIFKVVFLFSYQSSSLSNSVFICVWEAFVSLISRGDLIIIAPPLPYVNNFFQFFCIFFLWLIKKAAKSAYLLALLALRIFEFFSYFLTFFWYSNVIFHSFSLFFVLKPLKIFKFSLFIFVKTMLFNLSATSDYQFIYPEFYKNIVFWALICSMKFKM